MYGIKEVEGILELFVAYLAVIKKNKEYRYETEKLYARHSAPNAQRDQAQGEGDYSEPMCV